MQIDWPNFPFKHYAHYRALSMNQNDLLASYNYGCLTDRQYKWSMMFCCWSAVRLEGVAGKRQDRCYVAFGAIGVGKRIARIQTLKERYIQYHFGDWLTQQRETV